MVCGQRKTNLSVRDDWERKEQRLISRMRCGELLEMGPFPRRLDPTLSKACRWCAAPLETVFHCLRECTGLRDLRSRYEVRVESLARADSKAEISRILEFVAEAVSLLNTKEGTRGKRGREESSTQIETPMAGKRIRVVILDTHSQWLDPVGC